MNINLKDYCDKRTVTREDGKHIQVMISDSWDKEQSITIDFSNILIASVSFFDEAFGKLAFKYPINALKEKMKFQNIEKYDRALLNDIMISRYHQKELGQNGHS